MAKSEAKRPRRGAVAGARGTTGDERPKRRGIFRAESIGTASFYQWRRRMGGRGRKEETMVAASSPTPTFLDLGSMGGSDLRWELELELGAGIVLRLRGG